MYALKEKKRREKSPTAAPSAARALGSQATATTPQRGKEEGETKGARPTTCQVSSQTQTQSWVGSQNKERCYLWGEREDWCQRGKNPAENGDSTQPRHRNLRIPEMPCRVCSSLINTSILMTTQFKIKYFSSFIFKKQIHFTHFLFQFLKLNVLGVTLHKFQVYNFITSSLYTHVSLRYILAHRTHLDWRWNSMP